MNPILSIWTQPSKTIEHLIEHKKVSYALLIIMLGSMSQGVIAFKDTGFLYDFSLPAIIAITLVLSLVGGLAGWGITIPIYTWIGKWLGGSGTMRNMSLAIVAPSLLTIWTAPVGILAVILYGKELFSAPDIFAITNMSTGFYLFNALLMLGISIYSMVVLSKGVGIVHEFSAWRGFGTIMIFAGFIFVISIIVIISLIPFFFLRF